MSEFVNRDFKIYVVYKDDIVKKFTLGELIPHSFKL